MDRIVAVDYGTNVITVDQSITWNAGDGIGFPYSGSAPDIGAHEFTQGGSTIPRAPSNLRLTQPQK